MDHSGSKSPPPEIYVQFQELQLGEVWQDITTQNWGVWKGKSSETTQLVQDGWDDFPSFIFNFHRKADAV